MLDVAKTNSVILYDFATEIAWVLPMISVVIYLVQSWVKKRHRDAQINYPTFEEMSRDQWSPGLDTFLGQGTIRGVDLKESVHCLQQYGNEEHCFEDIEITYQGKQNSSSPDCGYGIIPFDPRGAKKLF